MVIMIKKDKRYIFISSGVLILSNIYLEDLFRKVGCCCCYDHQRDGHTDIVTRLWWVEPPMKQRWRSLLTEGRCPTFAETRYLGTSFSFLFPSNMSWQNGYTLFPISNKAKYGKISIYISQCHRPSNDFRYQYVSIYSRFQRNITPSI